MGERMGFWSQRRRRGQDDARLLSAEKVHELRHVPYVELVARAARGPQVEQVVASSGQRYERRTEVRRHERGGQEELRITVQVTDGTLLRRLYPLAEAVVLATPDGEW